MGSRSEDMRRWTIVRRNCASWLSTMWRRFACARGLVAAASRCDARRRFAGHAGGGGDAVLMMSRRTCPHNPTRLGGTAEAAKRHQLSSAPNVTRLRFSRNKSSCDDVAFCIASLRAIPPRRSYRNRLHGVDRTNQRFGTRLFLECARGGAHA